MIDRRRALLSEITAAKNTFFITLDSDTNVITIPLSEIEGTPVFVTVTIWNFDTIKHIQGECFACGGYRVFPPTSTVGSNGAATILPTRIGERTSTLSATIDEANNTLIINALRGYNFSSYYQYIVIVGGQT